MKRTLLRWHLGLGDALLCNGLVRVLVERGHKLILPCWPRNFASIKAMFADLGDDVGIVALGIESHMFDPVFLDDDVIALGTYGDNFDPLRFDESFYKQAGVPFLAKWEKFKVPEGSHRLVPLGAPFIHDDSSRGFVIPMDGFRPDRGKDANILSWLPYMRTAYEIHCINSCFAILADLICDHPDDELFLHRYARPDGGALPILGRAWTILDKPL